MFNYLALRDYRAVGASWNLILVEGRRMHQYCKRIAVDGVRFAPAISDQLHELLQRAAITARLECSAMR